MKKLLLLSAFLFLATVAVAQPTTAPSISNPSYGTTNVRANAFFSWGNVNGATYYEVQYDTLNSFNSGYLFSDTFYLRSTYLSDLLFGKRHYIRVRGVNAQGNGPWSSAHYFTTLYVPDVLSFTTGNGFVASIVTTYHTGALLHHQFDTTPLFNSGALKNVVSTDPDSGSIVYRDLLFNQKYYFRSRTFHSRDTSDWINTRQFTTLGGSVIQGFKPNSLKQNYFWTAGYYTGITYPGVLYEFQLDTSPAYNSSLLIANINDSLRFDDSLSNRYTMGSKWHVRVRTLTPVDTSTWSEGDFTIFSSPIILKPLASLSQAAPLIVQPENHTGVDYFIYELDTVADFSSAYSVPDTLTNWTASPSKTLAIPFFGQHWLRMWAVAGADTSEAALVTFVIRDNVLPLSPANNITYQPAELKFTWQQFPNVSYQVQVDSTNSFTSMPPRIFDIPAGKTDTTLGELYYGMKNYWRIRVLSPVDTGNWQSVRNFTVISAPALSWPSNFETSHSITDDLTCDELIGSDYYEFAISKSASFDTVYTDTARVDPFWGDVNISLTQFPMLYSTQYYWKARAIHARDTSEWSSVWTFTTSPEMPKPPKAVLVKPANGAQDLPKDVTLEWQLMADTFQAHYWLQWGTDPNFVTGTDSMLIIFIGNVNPTEKLENLPLSTTYFWRVKGANSEKEGEWSDTWSFTTLTPMPAPTPISPVSVSGQFLTVTLRWNKVPRATQYRYRISDQPNLSALSPSTTTDTFVTVTLTKTNWLHFWHVGARNPTEQSPYCNPVSFSTGDGVTSVVDLSNDETLKVYPNPAQQTLYIVPLELQVLSWEIVSADGRSYEKGNTNLPERINVSHLPGGMYILKVLTTEGMQTVRWVR